MFDMQLIPYNDEIKDFVFLKECIDTLETDRQTLSFTIPQLSGVFHFRVRISRNIKFGKGRFSSNSLDEPIDFIIHGRDIIFLYDLE